MHSTVSFDGGILDGDSPSAGMSCRLKMRNIVAIIPKKRITFSALLRAMTVLIFTKSTVVRIIFVKCYGVVPFPEVMHQSCCIISDTSSPVEGEVNFITGKGIRLHQYISGQFDGNSGSSSPDSAPPGFQRIAHVTDDTEVVNEEYIYGKTHKKGMYRGTRPQYQRRSRIHLPCTEQSRQPVMEGVGNPSFSCQNAVVP
jgi:hypothetical protein